MKAFWVCAVSKVRATSWYGETSHLSDVSSVLREFGIASPCKHTAQALSWPPAAQAHISCHLKAAHQKASFKETPQAAAFEEAETKAFATSACRASPGQRISGRFPWGTHFSSLLHQFLQRTAGADERLLELLFPAIGGSLFAAPHQGSCCRALRTQIQQRKSSLESLVVSAVAEAWAHFHTRLFHWGCPALTSASLWTVPRAAGSEEDKHPPPQLQPKCQHTNVQASHLSHPNPFKPSPSQCFCSALQTACKHRTGSLCEEIALWSYSLVGVNVTSWLE